MTCDLATQNPTYHFTSATVGTVAVADAGEGNGKGEEWSTEEKEEGGERYLISSET